MSVGSWLTERVRGSAGPAASTVPAPSFAYVFGWVLVLMLGLELVTGAALAAFYSPSTTQAWASVAYVQDQMAGGWFVRGLHHHGASALMIVAGLHLVQTAVWGSYKRPRELVWWIGVVLILLVLAFAITGYVLRWDQEGYWANQVEVGIAAGSPVIGATLKKMALGGNDYGNLTLTRFYSLHVALLPAIVALLVVGHIIIARRHGATPHWSENAANVPAPTLRWPRQTVRAALAAAAAFALLLGYVVYTHGAGLAAPADPTASFDARPLWYFRWLFALRKLAGSAEELIALVVPAIVMGALVGLPLVDHTNDRHPLRRKLAVGGVVGLFAIIGALTAMSFIKDMRNDSYAKRVDESATVASHMRALAVTYGVPSTGPQDLLAQQPMYRARKLYAQLCESCHDAKSKDRKGPIIAPGHGSRPWLAAMLKAPSDAAYWGKTKLSTTDAAMKPVELAPDAISDVIEALYAESGATDIDAAKRDRGKAVYNDTCNDCHSLEEGAGGGSGPGLGQLHSREWYVSVISNPKSAQHMGTDKSEMPRFDKDLTIEDRDRLAQYLVWLRTATQQDLAALGPL